jgi:hypothetical protein
MDRDFPMTSGQARATIIALVIAAVFGAALFGGYLPGLRPDYSTAGLVNIHGQEYYWEAVAVPAPLPGIVNFTLPQPFPFHNVTFWLWVTDWGSVRGGLLHGNASLGNGTQYPFELTGFGLSPRPVTEYFSPGGFVGASWTGGPLLDLYVLT